MANIIIDPARLNPVGDNLQALEQDGKLILVIDVKQTIGLSKTGRMMGVASSNGFSNLGSGLSGNIWIGKRTG